MVDMYDVNTSGELVNGRHVYVNENGTQNLFYLNQVDTRKLYN